MFSLEFDVPVFSLVCAAVVVVVELPSDPSCVPVSPPQRHTAQLREELLKLPCPDGLEPDGEEFSDKSPALMVKELPNQDGEKPGGSQDTHCSEGQL